MSKPPGTHPWPGCAADGTEYNYAPLRCLIPLGTSIRPTGTPRALGCAVGCFCRAELGLLRTVSTAKFWGSLRSPHLLARGLSQRHG